MSAEETIGALREALMAVDVMRGTLFIAGSETIWTINEWKRARDAALKNVSRTDEISAADRGQKSVANSTASR